MDFKEHFSITLAQSLGKRIETCHQDFSTVDFVAALPADFEGLEMKARVNALAEALYSTLDLPYPKAITVLLAATDAKASVDNLPLKSFPIWILSTIIETYGREHFTVSMAAIYHITQLFTGEFAIRPFINSYPTETLALLETWASDPSDDVRRLVTEGSRSKLPWATKVAYLSDNPQVVMTLLERLKFDDAEYVRRSVANNLNDISKDHPALVISTLRQWQNESEGTIQVKNIQWIAHHALRTLCKQGNADALALLGYAQDISFALDHFRVTCQQQGDGKLLKLSYSLSILKPTAAKLMVDFAISKTNQTGKISRKVYKWSKRSALQQGQIIANDKLFDLAGNKQKDYAAGLYEVTLIANGKVIATETVEIR